MENEFDIIIFGATGFVGKIVVRYLLERYGCNDGLRWAIAARSINKLEQLKSDLGDKAEKLPAIIGDANDEESLIALTARTTLIASTAGPYALQGEILLKACVNSGTHYCDLTGETQWIYSMLQRYEAKAQETGARIVHCCGFDSIPSDLGVWFLHKQFMREFNKKCTSVEMFVHTLKGGISGGTSASIVNAVTTVKQNRKLKLAIVNPYFLCPVNHGLTAEQATNKIGYNKTLDTYWAPFIMSVVNTRVVHRSNALLNHQYGPEFLYSEATATGSGLIGYVKATSLLIGLSLFMAGLYFSPTRWLLRTLLLPATGTGPSKQTQDKGCYDLRFVATIDSGEQMICKVTGDKDPGYGSTAKMCAEAALCNAFDVQHKPGGFHTPASLMAEPLMTRLTQNAGLSFEILKVSPAA